MDKSSHHETLHDRPVVICPLTEFGVLMATELARSLEGTDLQQPTWTARVPLGADPAAEIPAALTDVLHVERVLDHACSAPCCSERVFRPRFFLCGAAAEMTADLEPLRLALSAARQELNRTGLRGRVFAFIYTGIDDSKLPSPDVLSALAEVLEIDAIFTISDSSSSGYRLRPGDVPTAAALQMETVARYSEIEDRLTAAARRGPNRLLTLGVARVHVSDDSLRSAAKVELHRRLSAYILQLDRSQPPLALSTVAGSEENFARLNRVTPRLANVAEALQTAVESKSSQERTARLRRQAQETRAAVSQLLKTPQRRSWWSRLVGLFQRRAGTPDASHFCSDPNENSNSVTGDLPAFERRHLHLTRLLTAASAGGVENSLGTPWELHLAQNPLADAHLKSLLPPVERIASQLAAQFEKYSRDVAEFPRELDALCRGALRGIDLRPVLAGANASEQLSRASAAAAPLMPVGMQTEQWCLLPAGLPPAWHQAALAQAYEVLSGSGDVIVLKVAAPIVLAKPAGETR